MNHETKPGDKLRLFYALWPDEATRETLRRIQQQVAGRRIAHANLHITLAFLGQQSTESLPVLRDILAHLPPMSINLRLDRVGYFQRNRIVWIGAHATPDALFDLQRHLTAALDRHGIAYDNRNAFKPHLTIARDAPPPGDVNFEPSTWQASQVVLAASTLGAGGSAYRFVATRNLLEQLWFPEPGQAGSPESRPPDASA